MGRLLVPSLLYKRCHVALLYNAATPRPTECARAVASGRWHARMRSRSRRPKTVHAVSWRQLPLPNGLGTPQFKTETVEGGSAKS